MSYRHFHAKLLLFFHPPTIIVPKTVVFGLRLTAKRVCTIVTGVMVVYDKQAYCADKLKFLKNTSS